jgi:cell division protein FtsI/penicillin-binding protein 2
MDNGTRNQPRMPMRAVHDNYPIQSWKEMLLFSRFYFNEIPDLALIYTPSITVNPLNHWGGLIVLILAFGWPVQGSGQSGSASRLQTEMARVMAGRPGAVVALDVATGKLLAQWNITVAAQRLERPGSTVKPFVLMELLRSGKVQPDQRLACRRPLYISGHRMDCTHSPAVASLDAVDAIAYSCNSYFSTMALRMNAAELAQVFQRAGFTSPTGLAAGEAVGRIEPPQSQPKLQLQALGDWGIQITPLELLFAYRTLARQKLGSQKLDSQQQSSNPGFASAVFQGLERSVLYGIAHAAQPTGTTAAGKTGTASGVNTIGSHGFFVGYAPADKPEIVLLVYLEHGRGMDAAAVAAPVFTSYWKLWHGDGK